MNPLHKSKALNTKANGFTLIEIMITVAIMGIITVSGWPAYERYQQKSRRTEGVNTLLQNVTQLEKCFINYGAYNNANCVITQNTKGYYTITPTLATSLGAASYTLTASPAAAQAGDSECGQLHITHLGVKTNTSTNTAPDPVGTPRRCWSQ